jgi:hypothetical protein
MTLQFERRAEDAWHPPQKQVFFFKADRARLEGRLPARLHLRSRVTPDLSEMRPRRKKGKSSLTRRIKAELRANRYCQYSL